MHRNVYLGGTGKTSDISIRFLDPDFFMSSEISATWGLGDVFS